MSKPLPWWIPMVLVPLVCQVFGYMGERSIDAIRDKLESPTKAKLWERIVKNLSQLEDMENPTEKQDTARELYTWFDRFQQGARG